MNKIRSVFSSQFKFLVTPVYFKGMIKVVDLFIALIVYSQVSHMATL